VVVGSVVVLAALAAYGSTLKPPTGSSGLNPSNPALAENSPTVVPGTPLATDTEPVDTPIATPIFADVALKGKGNRVTKFSVPDGAIAIALVSHRGSSNFIVESINAGGSSIDLLVNTIGNYKGTVLFGIGDEHPVAFKVTADGSWTITVKPGTEAPIWDRATTLKGTGDSVYIVSPPGSGLATLDLKFKGDANFVVTAYGPNGIDLLANEIGNFEGQALLPDGAVILEVLAEGGTWTATSE
jgi:hypothetical protein